MHITKYKAVKKMQKYKIEKYLRDLRRGSKGRPSEYNIFCFGNLHES